MPEPITQIDAFTFTDPDTGEECWAGVRNAQGRILLALSRRADGDVEVTLNEQYARRLAQALTDALSR